jgi:chemotaxis protein methyltransferase CheR
MDVPVLQDKEFALFKKMIYEIAGINMSDAKKALVSGRLAKRIKHFGLDSYGEYFKLLSSDPHNELQMAVDLLTTNETFFFREPKHFDFMRDRVLPSWYNGPRRLWSAASSSGEEAYTMAMILAEHSPTKNWEIVGTDICTQVLERARNGKYPMPRAKNIPRSYLTSYCLKGIGSQEGTFVVGKELRERVSFIHANLKGDLSKLGSFDVIFLRNVLIYFDIPTKQQVVDRLVCHLKPGGFLVIGHSESLNGITNAVSMVVPSVYRRP